MTPDLPGGRGPLLAAAILHLIAAAIMGFSVDNRDPVALVEEMHHSATANVFLGAFFLGIWAWARKSPLAASITGLIAFIVVQLGVGIVMPSSLTIGLIANIIILGFLIRSVRAAKAAQEWDKQQS